MRATTVALANWDGRPFIADRGSLAS